MIESHPKAAIERRVTLCALVENLGWLLDHNETLFYRTVMSDPARFLPIVYDPTIGEACLKQKQHRGSPCGGWLRANLF
jgi:malic enzyme